MYNLNISNVKQLKLDNITRETIIIIQQITFFKKEIWLILVSSKNARNVGTMLIRFLNSQLRTNVIYTLIPS